MPTLFNVDKIYLRCGATAIIFVPFEILREFTTEDNFNNTFSLIKVIPVIPITWNAAKVVKRIEKQKNW